MSFAHLVVDLGPECVANILGPTFVIDNKPAKVPAHSNGRTGYAEVKRSSFFFGSISGIGLRYAPGRGVECRVRSGDGRAVVAGGVLARLDLDLAAKVFHYSLELAQTFHELDFAIAGLLGWRIRILGSWSAGRSTGSWEDALDVCLATIAAGHVLVTADLALATHDTGAGIEGVRGRQRGVESHWPCWRKGHGHGGGRIACRRVGQRRLLGVVEEVCRRRGGREIVR